MKAKRLNDIGDTTWAVILDRDEKAVETLAEFARQQNLSAARITGIGAFSRATLGFFDRERKDYQKIEIAEQTEVLSLLGNIVIYQDEPKRLRCQRIPSLPLLVRFLL
ncbi:MAG: PPC domain-containing DNA-binding protein, partial [Akkermansiaceae bacterium]